MCSRRNLYSWMVSVSQVAPPHEPLVVVGADLPAGRSLYLSVAASESKPLWPRTKSSLCEICTEKEKEKIEISLFPDFISKMHVTVVLRLYLCVLGE